MVASASRYYSTPLKGHYGVTQGYPLPTKLFNVLVDAIVRHWMAISAEEATGSS